MSQQRITNMLVRKTPTKRKMPSEEEEESPKRMKVAEDKEEEGETAAVANVESEAARFTSTKLDPFDKKYQERVTVVGGGKKKTNAVYAKCRFDNNGVMSVEELDMEQRDNGGNCGKSKFDGLVLKKYKKGENEHHRIDAKGKLQQRFGFFIRLSLMADFLFALKKVWAACRQSELPDVSTILKTQPNEFEEVDISNATENVYTSEICQ